MSLFLIVMSEDSFLMDVKFWIDSLFVHFLLSYRSIYFGLALFLVIHQSFFISFSFVCNFSFTVFNFFFIFILGRLTVMKLGVDFFAFFSFLSSLSFMDLYVAEYHHLWGIFNHYFFKYFFLLHILSLLSICNSNRSLQLSSFYFLNLSLWSSDWLISMFLSSSSLSLPSAIFNLLLDWICFLAYFLCSIFYFSFLKFPFCYDFSSFCPLRSYFPLCLWTYLKLLN